MINKRKGSLFIEVLVSSAIVVVIINIVIASIVQVNKSILVRSVNENVNRIMYSLMKEIKYNYSLEEINNQLYNDKIGFSYNENFLRGLMETPLMDMERGEAIVVEKTNELNHGTAVEFKIKIKGVINGVELDQEQVFIKSIWMEKLNEE